jgi:ketosteroid isomerase-like protein
MPEDSDVPTLSDLVRQLFQEVEREDWDGVLGFFAPDAVFDTSPVGLETSIGHEATRAGWESWVEAFDEWNLELEEVHELGSGVVLARTHQQGQPIGSPRQVAFRREWVLPWVDGRVARFILSPTANRRGQRRTCWWPVAPASAVARTAPAGLGCAPSPERP